jgi:DDE superfamily endonuclease
LAGKVLYLSPTYGGAVQNKKICDEEQLTFSRNMTIMADLGFLGLSSENAKIILPHKQYKNRPLEEKQQAENTWHAHVRVKVEHTIACIKRFRKVKETYRGRLYGREDRLMLICCALHNLRIEAKFA